MACRVGRIWGDLQRSLSGHWYPYETKANLWPLIVHVLSTHQVEQALVMGAPPRGGAWPPFPPFAHPSSHCWAPRAEESHRRFLCCSGPGLSEVWASAQLKAWEDGGQWERCPFQSSSTPSSACFPCRRLNDNEISVLEATGIFKKLPNLRKM